MRPDMTGRVAIITGSPARADRPGQRRRGRRLFLESSPYITGEILHIDGGQIAGH